VTDVKGDQSGNFCGYRNGEIVQMGVDKKGALVVNVADPEKLFTSVGGLKIANKPSRFKKNLGCGGTPRLLAFLTKNSQKFPLVVS
jgi:hypothetical protein